MPGKLCVDDADIYSLPIQIKEPPGTKITIGDLHGNAMKLIFVLVKHGFIRGLTNEDYNEFVKIYQTPVDQIAKEHLDRFNAILDNSSLEFNNVCKLNMLGDEFADRGSNDYFTLKILKIYFFYYFSSKF